MKLERFKQFLKDEIIEDEIITKILSQITKPGYYEINLGYRDGEVEEIDFTGYDRGIIIEEYSYQVDGEWIHGDEESIRVHIEEM